MRVSIVVPILNEVNLVSTCLGYLQSTLADLSRRKIGQWEVVVSDAGSTDGTVKLINKFMTKENWKFEKSNISHPSIGKTIKQGIHVATGDYIWILPVDTRLQIDAFVDLWEIVSHDHADYIAFPKLYAPSTTLLKLYQFLQNTIRLKLLKHVVWTNGIVLSKRIFESYDVPTVGFMEDVIWSDQLRKKIPLLILTHPIEVSTRRYHPSGILRQIFVNFIVMLLYRIRLVKPQNLKTIYNR
ncbi:MAG: glycosyltransferase [Bdellovibrionales bacterium]